MPAHCGVMRRDDPTRWVRISIRPIIGPGYGKWLRLSRVSRHPAMAAQAQCHSIRQHTEQLLPCLLPALWSSPASHVGMAEPSSPPVHAGTPPLAQKKHRRRSTWMHSVRTVALRAQTSEHVVRRSGRLRGRGCCIAIASCETRIAPPRRLSRDRRGRHTHHPGANTLMSRGFSPIVGSNPA